MKEVVKDGKTIVKMTSEWTRKKDQSCGKGMNKHHATLMCKLHDAKEPPAEDALTSEMIYEAHLDERVRKANDWVTQLGGRRGVIFIFYGCIHCAMWTVGSNHWYRVLRRVAALSDNSTTDGAKVGDWRCCGCFGKWTWGDSGHMRLTVVGQASESGGFEPGYEFALIGNEKSHPTNDPPDIKINFLKTATLLTELDGAVVSDDALLGALDAIQKRVEKMFSKGMDEVTVEYSKPVPQHKLDEANVAIICQNPRLSMPSPGRRMLVIKRSSIEKNGKTLKTIDSDEMSFLLDIVASTYGIEQIHPGRKAMSTKAIRQQILDSDGFKLGRAGIRARM